MDRDQFGSCRLPPPCALFRFDRIGVALHRSSSAKSSASARWFLFGPEPRGHAEPLEMPYAGRRVLKKIVRSRGDTRRPQSYPVSGDGCWSPADTCRPRSCPELGGGNRSCGDTWCPRNCHAWPRSCPEPGGGNRSCGDTWCPRSCPVSREVGTGAAVTHDAPRAALC
jgi:hypothetical protein